MVFLAPGMGHEDSHIPLEQGPALADERIDRHGWLRSIRRYLPVKLTIARRDMFKEEALADQGEGVILQAGRKEAGTEQLQSWRMAATSALTAMSSWRATKAKSTVR